MFCQMASNSVSKISISDCGKHLIEMCQEKMKRNFEKLCSFYAPNT